MGKPLGSFQILQHVASSLKSMVVIDAGESAKRQYVCVILELAIGRGVVLYPVDGGWPGLL
jgi:hypothetical protein